MSDFPEELQRFRVWWESVGWKHDHPSIMHAAMNGWKGRAALEPSAQEPEASRPLAEPVAAIQECIDYAANGSMRGKPAGWHADMIANARKALAALVPQVTEAPSLTTPTNDDVLGAIAGALNYINYTAKGAKVCGTGFDNVDTVLADLRKALGITEAVAKKARTQVAGGGAPTKFNANAPKKQATGWR